MSFGTGTGKPIGVLVVDDHPVVRGGLCAALSSQADMKVLGEARDGIEAEEKALGLEPDVIMMDINMPRRNGLEAMLSIKQKLHDVKILFLTVSEHDEDLLKAMRFGSDGYLLKKSDIKDVMDGIRRIIAGEAILSPEMTSRLLLEFKKSGEEPSLSPREKEVLALIGDGLTTSEIADRLIISRGSASTYIHRIIEKLHLKNKAEAMAYSLRHTIRQ
ncbi:MAG: response regulator transcription factor [Dehalococcoidales bacterium]|nr:response regulator transcription factor [Dehalococcoidales bacterium]